MASARWRLFSVCPGKLPVPAATLWIILLVPEPNRVAELVKCVSAQRRLVDVAAQPCESHKGALGWVIADVSPRAAVAVVVGPVNGDRARRQVRFGARAARAPAGEVQVSCASPVVLDGVTHHARTVG